MEHRMTEGRIREILQRAGERQNDALEPRRRRQLVSAAAQGVQPAVFNGFGLTRLLALAGAAAAAIAILVSIQSPPEIPASKIVDFNVATDGGDVVLSWRNGGATRKVFRATSREELASIRELPAQSAAGEVWVDREPSSAPITYYVVE
jgi:hypothetical protein